MENIEKLIENEEYERAQEELGGIDKKLRDARWHFLQGKLYFSKKWYLEARKQFRLAASNADPENKAAYEAALNDLEELRKTPEYKQYRTQKFADDCVNGCCDFCAWC